MKIEIITIGDELLFGQILDTNAAFISEKATEAGGQVVWRTTVGDDPETITESIGRAMQRADMVITTGGLGPTSDDVTKKAICKFFKRPLIFYDKILKKIENRFKERGLTMPAVNQNQALLPQGAEFVDNPIGSAVGIAIENDEKLFVAIPGVPSEMEAMTLDWITESIKKRSAGSITLHRKIRTVGIIESVLYEKIADLIDPKSLSRKDTGLSVAFLPSWKGVDLRLTAIDSEEERARQEIATLEAKIDERIGKYVYGYNDDNLAGKVGDMLREKHLTLAVAESCTGGLLGKMVTDIPGSSDYFVGGITAYTNEMKMKLLSVPDIILEKYGAVSDECARYMAEGVSRNLGADIGVSITGIAGPSGGTEEKPVGLVYVAVAAGGKTGARERRFGNDRERNRERSAVMALDMIRRYLVAISES
jgi:nicotinamide-nucleotide amidase